MIKFILTAILLSPLTLIAQNNVKTYLQGEDTLFVEQPSFNQGKITYTRLDSFSRFDGDIQDYVASKLSKQLLEKFRSYNTIIIKVSVSAHGSITEIHFLTQVDRFLSKEIEKILTSMPPWKPAYFDGKAVDSDTIIKINS